MSLTTKKHKHFILDQAKIERAQKLLGTPTEKETIERALEEVIQERARNKKAWTAALSNLLFFASCGT